MKKIWQLRPVILLATFILVMQGIYAQNNNQRWPSLSEQLKNAEARPGTAFAALIRANQNFFQLRADEATDKRGLPPWLRVYWRKAHPEVTYSAADPTGGYPHVLKEILEWMQTHQDLKPGPGKEPSGKHPVDGTTNLVTNEVRTSGAQAVPRSESDIRINFFDPTKILAASNNIGGTGRQGVYYSTNSGVNWSQTELPLTSTDASHSDPTVEWTSDGKAWSSTLGIVSTTLRMRNYVSADNGATWTLDGTPSGTQTNVDKQMVWVDHSSTSPYKDQQYAIWHNGAPAFMNRRTPGVAGTWLAAPIQVSGVETSGTAIGSDVKTNSYGDVFGFWPASTGAKLFMVKSTDGGNTYGTPVQIATTYDSYDIGVPSFNNRRALIYVSGGAYRTVSKDMVYATWTDLSGDAGCTVPANEPGANVASTCKTRIWFSRSTNGGTTWSAPVKINPLSGLNDQYNPWLAVDETNGNIGIMYYDTQADAGRKKTHVYYQYSSNDGVSWSAPEQITSAQTDETSAGANSGNQYGDYNGLSVYNNVAMPVWTDRRTGNKEEIWTAKTSNTPTPLVVGSGYTVTSGSNCGITTLDPNEIITVNLGLINSGNAATGTITATLQSTGGVLSPSGPQNYGVLGVSAAAVTRPFTFTLNATCGGVVTATLQVTDGTYSTNVTYIFTLGTVTPINIFTENFDGVTAPALPAGWTTAQTGATPPALFATTATTPSSSPNATFTNGVATVASNSLISPIINIPAAGTKQITFNYTTNFESTYDGGVLEISTDGGANYVDITDASAGGTFSANGYNSTISSGFSNPIGGRQAWSGAQATYVTVSCTLPNGFGGANCKLRWRGGWDNSTANANPNWRIDNVSIVQNVPVCSTCPEIDVQGNNVSIPSGSASATLTNHTDFGVVILPASFARTYTIKNTGTATLNVSSITKTGNNPGDFVVSGITLPTTVISGGSSTFTVTFTPSAPGVRNAVIHVNNDDADESDYNFVVAGCSPILANNLDANSVVVSTGINTVYSSVNPCNLIGILETTASAGQVTGIVTNKVWVETTQPTYNGSPYVKRHYEITPATNPATSSAKISLYFLQTEFDAYNAVPGHGVDLPTGPGDALGIGNLRILKFAGTSSDGTGTPGSYGVSGVMLNPDDADITWDVPNARWKVSLNVTGFSGFFASNSNTGILPVSLLQFAAVSQNINNTFVTWKVAQAEQGVFYELQRSGDGISFNTINTQNGNTATLQFNYTDASLSSGRYYYRLKMISWQGNTRYSNIAIVKVGGADVQVFVYPNPVKKAVSLMMQVSISQASVQAYTLTDTKGRMLLNKTGLNATGSFGIPLPPHISAGIYYLRLQTDKGMNIEKIVVQ